MTEVVCTRPVIYWGVRATKSGCKNSFRIWNDINLGADLGGSRPEKTLHYVGLSRVNATAVFKDLERHSIPLLDLGAQSSHVEKHCGSYWPVSIFLFSCLSGFRSPGMKLGSLRLSMRKKKRLGMWHGSTS